MFSNTDIPDILRMRNRAVRKRTRVAQGIRGCGENLVEKEKQTGSQNGGGANMIILAVDPGTEKSAWVLYDTEKKTLVRFGLDPNPFVLQALSNRRYQGELFSLADILILEMFKSYGNVMGDSVLQTCVWIGRFIQACIFPHELVPRKTVVTHLCMNPRANDSNVRMALIDRFSNGQGSKVAIGSKAAPGPLFGLKNDIWSALAIAVSWSEMREDLENKLN